MRTVRKTVCVVCGHCFTSAAIFDMHRIRDKTVKTGRRCMTETEMRDVAGLDAEIRTVRFRVENVPTVFDHIRWIHFAHEKGPITCQMITQKGLSSTLSVPACFSMHFVTGTAEVPAHHERDFSSISCCKQANSLNVGESPTFMSKNSTSHPRVNYKIPCRSFGSSATLVKKSSSAEPFETFHPLQPRFLEAYL